jgi:MFS family permease
VLAFRGQAQLWQIYLMATLVGAGFWMFWPTITALIQELTPDTEFVHANTFLLAAVQGGWLMAGAVVGFIYNHVGLGGVLLIDAVTYVVSFLCYFAVRRGRVVVRPPDSPPATAEGALARFLHELREGITFLQNRPHVVLLGTSWALFIGAMLTQGVITAPLGDRVLHAGAVGYGWLNAGWAIGAFTSAWYAPVVIRALAARRAVGVSMTLLAASLFLLPYSRWLAVAVALYALMGTGRGIGGVAISSSMMEVVPRHFMGRVQNTFFFFGTCLQLALGFTVGAVAHRIGLTWAFAIVGFVYLTAAVTAIWPVEVPAKARAQPESTPAD